MNSPNNCDFLIFTFLCEFKFLLCFYMGWVGVRPEQILSSFLHESFPLQGSSFHEDCLLRHNQLRRFHKVPPLTLDAEVCIWDIMWYIDIKQKYLKFFALQQRFLQLSEGAQRWANHLAQTNSFEHSHRGSRTQRGKKWTCCV